VLCQINVRVAHPLFRTLEAVARQERRSVADTARRLIEDGLRQRRGGGLGGEELAADEIGTLAREGGAFDWLADEPDLYGADSGESI
jgi:hypothetical protein